MHGLSKGLMNMRIKTPVIAVTACLACAAYAGEFHVAANGKDTNPGSAEKPFATLERARDAVRQAGDRAGAAVILHAGTYRMNRSLEFCDKDSGTEKSPVVWKAAPGATVRLLGGAIAPAAAVQKVTDKAVLNRVADPKARANLWQINLAELGIKDCGQIGPHGFRRPYIPAPAELFINGKVGMLARWPNPGEPLSPMGKVLDKGSVTRNGEPARRGGKFVVKTDRPKQWAASDDIWIYGLFENGYADSTVKIASIASDTKEGLVFTTVQPHMYGFSSGKPWNAWFAMNLIEEIDLPGEYALDRKAGRIYFLPLEGADPSKAEIVVSELEQPMFVFENASHIRLENLVIECARGMGVYIERGQNVRVVNCTLRNLGMVAACIGQGISADPDYQHGCTGTPISRDLGSWHEHIYNNTTLDRNAGTGHGLIGCHIHDIGSGAISLGGGNRVTLTPAGNFVENCRIHDFNRWDRTYRSAVNIDGVGNRVAHCEIYNAPGSAIYLHGNEHVIEYNEIHHVMMEGDDMGAFYMGRDPSERGNVIRYNHWHDLAVAHRTYCIYLDDAGGDGTKIYGNVFRKAGALATLFNNGGSDISVTNNVFVNCKSTLRMQDTRYARNHFKSGLTTERLKAVGYDRSPWRERYPEFTDYLEWVAKRPSLPRRNLFARNLLVNSPLNAGNGIQCENNRSVAADPGMNNTGIDGFEPIPFDKIGLTGPVGPAARGGGQK
jgi:hypothetical protein